tara:strand:+ start:9755 stop:10144 length:390 start_codon:yes stop_codon:yes gene_type:complete
MKTIKIKPIGKVHVKAPDNWCTVADLSQGWSRIADNDILQTRVCAASIGMVWDHDLNKQKMPRYDFSRGDLFLYGTACQNQLHQNGVKLDQIFAGGIKVFGWLQDIFPTYEDIEKTADFSEADEAQATS